jgi:hypothetical protein
LVRAQRNAIEASMSLRAKRFGDLALIGCEDVDRVVRAARERRTVEACRDKPRAPVAASARPVNEFAGRPTGFRSRRARNDVTPVAKVPSAARKSVSKLGGRACGIAHR